MPRFGIMTAPMQVAYEDVLRVWREADTIPEIESAWLFDHLMPIGGDANGPAFEGWTLLSALAAQTERLRVGLLVTSNRFRPPAMLAKIAATVDVVAGGRLDFGIGAGSRPGHPIARREYEAHGLPFHDFDHSDSQPRRGAHGHPPPVDRGGAVRFRRRDDPAHGRVRQPEADPAAVSADHDRGAHRQDAARRRQARRPLEHPGRQPRGRDRAQRPARPLLCRDRSRPRDDHPLDAPLCELRESRAPRGTRSPRRATRGSRTSSSASRRLTPPRSRAGSPTR